jgi:hypothetical protein
MTPLRRLYVALGLVLVASAILWIFRGTAGAWAAAWMPNVGVGALTILVTLAFVNRILAEREREQSRDRVEQALGRVGGGLYTLADFLAVDYAAMHGDSYERPPNDLRGLLAHWKAGLETRDRPWPENLSTLAATKAIAGYLEEQVHRHERVLDHAFVAAAYAFIRSERTGRNMYGYEEVVHDEDGWKRTALASLADDVSRLLDAYEPYAREYLDRDLAFRLRDEAIDAAELISGHREARRAQRR